MFDIPDWAFYESGDEDFDNTSIEKDLSDANLNGENLDGVDLSGADMIRASLIDTKLRNANLSSANLSYADLTEADLSYADLNGANLSYADLSHADLNGANLSGANLSGSNLFCADLIDANLGDANLTCAYLVSSNLSSANLSCADLIDANLRHAVLISANLCSANLSYADLTKVDLSYADLNGSNLFSANLQEANLSEVDLSEANLIEVNFCGANLGKARLRRSNLAYANMFTTNLRLADLSDANLAGTILYRNERGVVKFDISILSQIKNFLQLSKIDWTSPLRALQTDFINRLKLGCLLHCEIEGQHSELTVISGKRLKQLINFCWEMAEKYKRNSSVRRVFENNMKGKLGEEILKIRLADLVTEVDYEKRLGGDGKVDFRLTSNLSIGIQVKTRYGNIDKVQWEISPEEVKENAVLVCILSQEEFDDRKAEYQLILAGFLPTNMIEVCNSQAVGINQLLYGGALRSYLQYLDSF